MKIRNLLATAFAAALGLFAFNAGADDDDWKAGQTSAGWAATWTAAPSAPSLFDPPPATFNDTTLRQIARVSVGGHAARVWLTNEFGTEPLTVGAATIALRGDGSDVRPATLRTLTFGGNAGITIAPGTRVVSDPVGLWIPRLADVSVSIHLPDDLSTSASPPSYHVRGLQTSYHAPGNQTGENDLTAAATNTSYYYLAGIDVRRKHRGRVVAALGDSITDGDQEQLMEPVDENARYTNFLARKLLRRGNDSVINLGISGNQVTATFIGDNAQARLNRDILSQTGVTHVIVLEGINDMGLPTLLNVIGIPAALISAETIISGHQQIAARLKAQGLIVLGGTLPPSGSSLLPGYSGAEIEAKRQAVNAWIRDSGTYDAVIDFDKVLRDPDDETVMRADLSADGLHPNTAGYKAMARKAARVLRRMSREDWDDWDDWDD